MNIPILERLKKTIQNFVEQIEERLRLYSNIPKILILGTKKSGKTTLISKLFNDTIKINFNHDIISDSNNTDCQDNQQIIDSCFQIYFDNINNLILIECHLFDDDELDQEIIKSLMINDIIQNNSESENKLKILLVMSTFECIQSF